MLDFLKLQILDKELISSFYSNTLLDWVSDSDKFNPFDCEVITTKKIRQYKGIYFYFYSDRLDILFKPHYHFNNNLHNANDFKIIDNVRVINDFKQLFNIDLKKISVVNIEFGLNVISPINIIDLLCYIIYHGKNEYRSGSVPYSKISYKPNKKGLPNQYKLFKIYAKGIQFPQYCDANTFRFEIKSKQSKFISNRLGIKTANDLLNLDVYFTMAKILKDEFQNVLILDCSTDFSDLQLLEQKKIEKFNNPIIWYKIKNSSNRNCFGNSRILYHKLINKAEKNLKKQLEKLIFDKLEHLKKGANSTVYKHGRGTEN